jgi:predicted SnoaL-like aldol condensation-catalyzing enzyme
MLTHTKAAEVGERWIVDWNQHNLDQIMAHYAENIEFTSPFIVKLLGEPSGVIHGKSALASYFAKGLAAYPNLKFEPIQVLAGVNSVLIYYHSVNHLLAAEFMELDTAGLVNRVVAHYSEPKL